MYVCMYVCMLACKATLSSLDQGTVDIIGPMDGK